MITLDSRIRKEHIARYGATEDVDSYLRTLEGLRPLSDDEAGENHHMLAKSIWPEYGDLKANPWNRLRVSYALHTALTEIQSWFEELLRFAALMMKGQTADARLETCSRAGKIGGKIGGKVSVESGHWARLLKLGLGGKIGGKRAHERHPNLMSEIGEVGGKVGGKIGSKITNCLRWNIRRGKLCTCGRHELTLGVAK